MCFTTCWQERVKKRGEPFTSRSLKNTITSVRWGQNIITTTAELAWFWSFGVTCLLSCKAVSCSCVCVSVSVLVLATGHVTPPLHPCPTGPVLCVCKQEREEKPGPKRKHIPLVLAFSTCCRRHTLAPQTRTDFLCVLVAFGWHASVQVFHLTRAHGLPNPCNVVDRNRQNDKKNNMTQFHYDVCQFFFDICKKKTLRDLNIFHTQRHFIARSFRNLATFFLHCRWRHIVFFPLHRSET